MAPQYADLIIPPHESRLRMNSFYISRLPRITYARGSIQQLPALMLAYGKEALLVTGNRSLRDSLHWQGLLSDFKLHGIRCHELQVDGEPSPQLVDDSVQRFRSFSIDVVIGIGGGSVLDAAKAIAGLLKPGNSVLDHLEGVGPELPYIGPSTPFIAVPTTAGTGSEATKNAVLSTHGPHGYKKSFRDEQLVAEHALIDPDLFEQCPPALIAANGMDAFTQLLESYVSSRANAFTDALAWSGMAAASGALLDWYENGASATDAQAAMAYAALLSGITLAQVGLGSVHGLASPLGAFFPIPHGVVCGTLVAAATEINLHALQQRQPASPALFKYAQVGRLLAADYALDDQAAHNALLRILSDWTARMQLPRLAHFGVTSADFQRIVLNSRGSSMKTNPVELSDAEIESILRMRL
jgi:alcohol dehydrogenase class IV